MIYSKCHKIFLMTFTVPFAVARKCRHYLANIVCIYAKQRVRDGYKIRDAAEPADEGRWEEEAAVCG